MKRSYSDLDQLTGDPPFTFGPAGIRGARQPKQYQQQTEPGTGKIKACMQCGTTRTPQWREGPYGPKTLCNACGVKRVRAIKAQQQGKHPSAPVNHPASATGAKKKASAAARTESIELATTLQLLAGNLEAGPPPAKRQARAGRHAGGRGRKAISLQATPNHVPEYDPFDPAAAAALSAPALGSAVQKAIAAIAAKGSMGGESNPTDSGEEISWSPTDHQQAAGDAGAAAAAGEGSRRQRQQQQQQQHQQQQQQLRAAMAAAAAAQLQNAVAEHEEMMMLPTLPGQQLDHTAQQQLEGGLVDGGYGTSPATADACPEGKHAADEEAAAVANLLSMSATADEQEQGAAAAGASRPASSAGKSAMRELVAALTAGSTPTPTTSGKSPARRQSTRTPPPRHVVTVRPRGGAAAGAGASTTAGISSAALLEEDVMYLLGPGMAVMARHVAPDELLEVIKLNELASEAQRHRAASEAAVEAVEQILRDKQQAAVAAQAAAHAAMQRLHSFVGNLNAEHELLLKAAHEQQQPAGLASRLAGGRVGSFSHLDLLAASLHQQHQQHQQQQQQHQQQQQQMVDLQDPQEALASLAAAAAAAAEPDVVVAAATAHVKAEPDAGTAGGNDGVDAAAGADAALGADAGDAAAVVVNAAAGDAAGADVDASGAAVQSQPAVGLLQPPQVETGCADVQGQGHQHVSPPTAVPAVCGQQHQDAPAEASAAAPAAEDLEAQAVQLLGSFQELAAIAGLSDSTGADNNGVAAAGSPAL